MNQYLKNPKTTAQLFWAKVDKAPGFGPDGNCWKWTATKNKQGYGNFTIYNVGGIAKQTVKAHRIAFELANSRIESAKLCVCHRCDNPSCVNPTHLFLGTQKDNAQDKVAKGRCANQQKTHCPQGHEYTAENTSYRTQGDRICRTCARDYHRNKKAGQSPRLSAAGKRIGRPLMTYAAVCSLAVDDPAALVLASVPAEVPTDLPAAS